MSVAADCLAQPVPLQVLYLDAHMVAVHKPAGLPVHRGGLASRDVPALLQLLRDQIGQRLYPVHRLDQSTSGVMVFGLSPDIARQLQAQLEAGTVGKTYRALVRGVPPDEREVDRPLSGARGQPERPAQTGIRTLARCEIAVACERFPSRRYALVEAVPRQGRFHQIRRHLAGINCPVIGDGAHGDHRHNKFIRGHLGIERMWLEAQRLALVHPVGGEYLDLHAAEDADWARMLQILDLRP